MILEELTPYFEVRSDDFGVAELQAIYNVVNFGKDITFGSEKEPKQARDSVHTIILTGNAIRQIEKGYLSELTQGEFNLGPKASQKYMDEWNRDWFSEYDKLPLDSKQRFDYTYIERLLVNHGDQLEELRNELKELIEKAEKAEAKGKEVIVSNRHQVITWDPKIDMGSDAPPCFQRAWIRYYHPYMIDIHFSWRSRDLRNAWKYNLIGAIAGFNKEIFFPNKCKIVRIIDQIDSLHIMHGVLGTAQKLLLEAQNKHPQIMRKILEY